MSFDPAAVSLFLPWSPEVLARLLVHFRLADPGDLPSQAVAQALALPMDAFPPELLAVLGRVNELDNDPAFEALLEGLGDIATLPASPCLSRTDLALVAWLEDPELFEVVSARHADEKKIAYREFQGRATSSALVGDTLRALGERLGSALEGLGRGAYCEVHACERDGHWLLHVSHGDTYLRLAAVEGQQLVQVECRPHALDRIVFSPRTGVLRVTGSSRRLRRALAEAVSFAVYGEQYGFRAGHVDLGPLVFGGAEALMLVEGVVAAKLVQTQHFHPDGEVELQGRVLELVAAMPPLSLNLGALYEAMIEVTFASGETTRVLLREPDVVGYDSELVREADATALGEFLRVNGLLVAAEQAREAC